MPPPCEGNAKAPKFEGNNTSSDRCIVNALVVSRAVLQGEKRFAAPTETNLHGDALCFMVKTWARHKTAEAVLNNGWRRLVVGGAWQLAVGNGRLAVGGGWQLAVGDSWSLGAVLNEKSRVLEDSPVREVLP